MAKKLTPEELKIILGNMQKPKQQINAVDETGKRIPRPEENPASKEAFWMWMNMNQAQSNANRKSNLYSSSPEPIYSNIGQKVRADLEREQRQRDMHSSIPNEKLNTWLENVGLPAADIGFAIDAGINIPKLLLKSGELASPALMKAASKNAVSKGENKLVNRFFNFDRNKELEQLEKELEFAKSLRQHKPLYDDKWGKKLEDDIADYEGSINGFRTGDITYDNTINPIRKKYLEDFDTEEFKKRAYEFMSPNKQREFDARSILHFDEMDKLGTNSDLTNFMIMKDAVDPGAYYHAGLNSIGINPKIYNDLINSGEEGIKKLKKVLEHEMQHHYQNVLGPHGTDPLTNEARNIYTYRPDEILDMNIPTEEKRYLLNTQQYFENFKHEKIPMISEVRSDLLNKGILKNKYDKVTPDMIAELRRINPAYEVLGPEVSPLNRYIHNTSKSNRLLKVLRGDKSDHNLSSIINKMLGVSGAAVGANNLLNKKDNNKNGN